MSCFLMVPGGKRTGRDWDQVCAILRGRGHQARAITLSEPSASTLSMHIDQTLAMLGEMDAPRVTLVGHSYASFVITGAAQRAAGRIERLVYVDSAVPHSGQSLLRVFALAGVDPAAFGVPSWPPFSQPLVFDQAIIDRIPKTYIQCLRSQFLELTAAAAARVRALPPERNWTVRALDTDHYCMVNMPQALADLLDA